MSQAARQPAASGDDSHERPAMVPDRRNARSVLLIIDKHAAVTPSPRSRRDATVAPRSWRRGSDCGRSPAPQFGIELDSEQSANPGGGLVMCDRPDADWAPMPIGADNGEPWIHANPNNRWKV